MAKPLRFAEGLAGTWPRFWFFGLFMTLFIAAYTSQVDDPRWFSTLFLITWQFMFLYTIRRLYLRLSNQANKQNATNFYSIAYVGNPRKAVELYVGDEYIQHNPLVGDGKAAFIDYFEKMATEYAEKSIEFVRSVAEGNLVALQTHQIWPGNDEYVTMDFFRFDENGKIVEHWDAVQQIPQTSENGNTMY